MKPPLMDPAWLQAISRAGGGSEKFQMADGRGALPRTKKLTYEKPGPFSAGSSWPPATIFNPGLNPR
jgi:hypothetical protein